MISWSRTLSVYKDFWYTYYMSIGHRQMFLLPADSADSADRADVVYTETPTCDKVYMPRTGRFSSLTPDEWSRTRSWILLIYIFVYVFISPKWIGSKIQNI